MTTIESKPKILLIHGFGGGVHEVQPLADDLVAQGYQVACPVLAGHAPLGGRVDRRILSRARWTDWVEDAHRELQHLVCATESGQLQDSSDSDVVATDSDVVVIGFSMGGLIAFQLAAQQSGNDPSAAQQSGDDPALSGNRIQSVITINTPIYYWNLLQVARNLLDDLGNRRLDHTRRYFRAKGNSPIPAMLEFLKLLRNTKRLLPRVNSPLLLLQAKDDDTVRLSSVNYLLSHLGSEQKSARFMKKGGHLILHSEQAQEVSDLVSAFLMQ